MKKLLLCTIYLSLSLAFSQVTTSTLTPNFNGAGAIVLDSEGNLYIADFGDTLAGPDSDGIPNDIIRMDTDLNLTVYSTGFVGASGNNFDNNGVLYQSDIWAGAIYRIVGGVRTFVTSTGIVSPVGLVFDDNDNFYVCNCGNNTIQKITPSGTSTVFASGDLNTFNCPNGITSDNDGNLYVTNFSNSNIIKITPNGFTSIIGSTTAGNGHIEYDPITSNLYIASFGGHQIFKVNIDNDPPVVEVLAGTGVAGNSDGDALTSTFSTPNGIAVTKTGDSIYVNSSANLNPNQLNPQVVRLIKGVLSTELSVETITLEKANVKTYPSPIEDKFFIDIQFNSDIQDFSIDILDINGKVVKAFSNLSSLEQKFKSEIDLKSLDSGIYFYNLKTSLGILKTGKLVKH